MSWDFCYSYFCNSEPVHDIYTGDNTDKSARCDIVSAEEVPNAGLEDATIAPAYSGSGDSIVEDVNIARAGYSASGDSIVEDATSARVGYSGSGDTIAKEGRQFDERLLEAALKASMRQRSSKAKVDVLFLIWAIVMMK